MTKAQMNHPQMHHHCQHRQELSKHDYPETLYEMDNLQVVFKQ
ncbi:MAG: hypothetical protein ACP5DZ_07035 [Bacteroidales bacterium]